MMKQISLLLLASFVAILTNASPIQLHPDNPHYFLYQGKPTLLITSAEHYGAVLNLDFDCETYLETLRADGLNYTRIFTGTYVEVPNSFGIEKNTLAPDKGRFIAPWARSGEPGYANGGNKFDLERWSDAYFNRLKDFLTQAGERGIVVEITLFSSIYTDENWNINAFNPKNNVNRTDDIYLRKVNTPDNGNIMKYQEAVVRKIVREVNAFDNCFFEIQNEPYADRKEIAHGILPLDSDALKNWQRRIDLGAPETLEWQKVIASYIVDEEKALPQKHLIAQNYCNFFYPLREVDANVSILNFHYARPDAVYLNAGFDRVVGFDESGFSGTGDDSYRRQAWNFILAGGGLFNHLDYSFSAEKEDGTDKYNAPGGGSPALRKQIGVLKEFMHRFDFVNMAPDFQAVKSAPGSFRRCLSNPGKEYAIYLHGSDRCELTLNLPAGNYRVKWVDTKSGEIVKRDDIQSDGGVLKVNSPVYVDDIALGIRRVD